MITTPEGLELTLNVAGPISRARAWLLDALIRAVIYIAFAGVFNAFGSAGVGIFLFLVFLLEWAYPVLFEVYWEGATPGKRVCRLRVLHDDCTPVDWRASVTRNTLRAVDFLPFCYGIGLVSSVLNRDFKRLGDLAAGTVVVHVAAAKQTSSPIKNDANFHDDKAKVSWQALDLELDEQRSIVNFAERRGRWSRQRAEELAQHAGSVVGQAQGAQAVANMMTIAHAISGVRQASNKAGGLQVRQEIFEARHESAWQEFELWLAQDVGIAEKKHQPSFAAHELPHRYRQIVRHLALARDRHYGNQLVTRLESIVLAGHQAIYAPSHAISGGMIEFIRRTFPRLVRQHWRYVLVASICLFGPMLGLIAGVYFFPDLAYVVATPEALAGAQQMYDPQNRVLGEARNAGSDLMMWGFYVANNVRIGFQCFAGGLLFGVGAIFFMLFNGLHIGAIAGYLTQLGYIETFWGFVAGHSALELFGIALCGASGLQLGHALIAPGRLTRLASLKACVPDAVRILYGAASMIFLAAFIEGFWSASRLIPVELKYTVGILFWVLMIAYFVFAGRGTVLKPGSNGAHTHAA